MKIYLVADQIKEVAERWRKQYQAEVTGKHGDRFAIYERLKALAPTATAADVARIIGNDSWIGFRCSECATFAEDYIEVGEEPDYESCTAYLCFSCARKVAEMIGSATDSSTAKLADERAGAPAQENDSRTPETK